MKYKGTFTDHRDGQVYQTVQIGSQIWMAENLNYKMDDSYCYNDDEAKGQKYGRLYTWDAAMKACPAGWHLPSKAEWLTLIEFVGGIFREDLACEIYDIADGKLKSTSGWKDCEGKSCNDTDEFGFSALPAGSRCRDGNYIQVGENTYFWSSTEHGSDRASSLSFYVNVFVNFLNGIRELGYSVRCIKDSE